MGKKKQTSKPTKKPNVLTYDEDKIVELLGIRKGTSGMSTMIDALKEDADEGNDYESENCVARIDEIKEGSRFDEDDEESVKEFVENIELEWDIEKKPEQTLDEFEDEARMKCEEEIGDKFYHSIENALENAVTESLDDIGIGTKRVRDEKTGKVTWELESDNWRDPAEKLYELVECSGFSDSNNLDEYLEREEQTEKDYVKDHLGWVKTNRECFGRGTQTPRDIYNSRIERID